MAPGAGASIPATGSGPGYDWVNFTTKTGDTAPANLGIYKLSGDAITICNGGPGNARPTEFKAGEGGQPPQLFVLNRKTAATEAATTGGDLARMQGRWIVRFGPNKIASTTTITIKGTTLQMIQMAQGQPHALTGEIKIDETAKPEKTLDWINVKAQTGQSALPRLAIYKLDGDTVTICLGSMGGDRPTEFNLREGKGPALLVLSRD